jgi:hypothetical protein
MAKRSKINSNTIRQAQKKEQDFLLYGFYMVSRQTMTTISNNNNNLTKLNFNFKRIVCWIKGHKPNLRDNVKNYSAYFCLCRRCFIPLHVARMFDKQYYYHVNRGDCKTKEPFQRFINNRLEP